MNRFLMAALLACPSCISAHAALRLGQPFGDHMVLPSDVPVVLWGTGAAGGDTVRVAIQGQTAVGSSDWAGRWMVQLKPLHAGGPFQMNVAVGGQGPMVPSSAANDTSGLELNDVLVGDVIPFSQLRGSGPVPAGQTVETAMPSAHPYGFVRVFSPAGPGWTVVRQELVPKGLEAPFAAGRARYAATHVPTGIYGFTAVAPCPPATTCSSH